MVRWAVRWYFSIALVLTLWDACIDGNQSLLIEHTTFHHVRRFPLLFGSWILKYDPRVFPQPFQVCLWTAVMWSFNFTSLLVSSYNNLNVISTFEAVLCHSILTALIMLSFPVIQILLHRKLALLECMYSSGVHFCSTFLYQFFLLWVRFYAVWFSVWC